MPRKTNSLERNNERSNKRLIESERELEEKVNAQRRPLPRAKGGNVTRGKNDKKSSSVRPAKAPLLLRVLAWCGVILLCTVAGYIGTDKMLLLLEKPFRNFEEELQQPLPPDDVKLDMQKTTLSLFYPKDGVMKKEEVDIIVRTREDNIQDVVAKLLALSGLFDETVYVKHVFRNVDTLYLNFSAPFLSALNAAGARLSTLFITGIVHTMQDNNYFSPITKVRFLVDSQIVGSSEAPVDLAAPWQLK